jgi:hypothetical protein
MPTFSELYPEYYNDEYQSQPPQAPAPDLMAQYAAQQPLPQEAPAQPRQSTFLNLPTSMRTELQSQSPRFEDVNPPMKPVGRALVRLTGGNYERDYLRQKQRYDLAQSQIESEKAHKAAVLAQTDANIEKAIWATPPGQRKGILGVKQRFYEAQGTKMDPAIVDWYNKAEQEDQQFGQAAVQLLLQQYPDTPPEEALKYFYSNHAGVAKLLGTVEELKQQRALTEKAQAEARQKNTESQFMEGLLPALQGAQGGGSAPQAPSPAPGTLVPQGAPQGPLQGLPEGKLTPVQMKIVQEAQTQGVDPAMALSFADTETGFKHVSGDGGEAAGYFQLHEPASIDAAKALGMDPTARHTPEGNIRLGVQYAKQVAQRGGSPAGAAALYNWGSPTFQGQGSPQYIQRFMQNYQKWGNVLGGRPVTEAAANADDATQARLTDLNTQIGQLQGVIQKYDNLGIGMVPMGKRFLDEKRETLKTLQSDYDRLMKTTEPKAVDYSARAARQLGVPLNIAQRTEKQQQAVDALVPILKGQEAEGVATAEAGVRRQEKDKELISEQLALATGLPPTTTLGQFKAMQGVTATDKLPEKQQDVLTGYATVYDMSNDLIKEVSDPNRLEALKPVIGTLLSNPEGWLARFKGRKISGLTNSQQEFAAKLALEMVTLRKTFLGTAQTAGETAAAEPFLTSLGDATPGNLKGKLQGIRDYARMSHDRARSTAVQLRQRVPDPLPEATPLTGEAPATPPKLPEVSGPKGASPALLKIQQFLQEN